MGSSSGSFPPSGSQPGAEAAASASLGAGGSSSRSELSTTALLAALGGALDGSGRPDDGESSWGLEQPDFVRLAARARAGHSPSARALVNASDLVVALSLSAPLYRTTPPPGDAPSGESPTEGAPPSAPSLALRARVLDRAVEVVESPAHVARRASGAPLPPTDVASEVVGRVHSELANEAERQRIIDALGATGGPGHEACDRALAAFLERLAPFMDFEVVLVSTVRGDKTFHRVHRGFPASYGNVDIIPRAASYCTHTVSADEPLIVHDGGSEAFFRRGAMVTKMHARAYLGIPIRAAALGAGAVITLGALCAIGTRPRQIGPREVAFAQLFAEEAEALVCGDAARVGAIRSGEVYRAPFFERILAAELERHHERNGEPEPKLAVVERSALAAIAHHAVVGDLDPAGDKVGILVANDVALAALTGLLPGARFVGASAAQASTQAWIELARGA